MRPLRPQLKKPWTRLLVCAPPLVENQLPYATMETQIWTFGCASDEWGYRRMRVRWRWCKITKTRPPLAYSKLNFRTSPPPGVPLAVGSWAAIPGRRWRPWRCPRRASCRCGLGVGRLAPGEGVTCKTRQQRPRHPEHPQSTRTHGPNPRSQNAVGGG
jgi:hypothetical protein